jgi:Uncharacterised nucleotidyltransferase
MLLGPATGSLPDVQGPDLQLHGDIRHATAVGGIGDRMSPIFTLLWGDIARAGEVAARLDRAGWQAIDSHALQHRLRPLLFRRASDGGWDVAPDLLRAWQASYRRSALRALNQKVAIARIGKALIADAVPAAILKGGAFVWSNAMDPALRPMRDIDLLIMPEDAEAATRALRSIGFEGGAHAPPSGKHLPAMMCGKVAVELHLHIFDTYDHAAATSERQFVERAWQRAVPAEVQGLQALCPTDTLLHLILHAVCDHQFNNGPLLLADMLALVAHGPIDWALFWNEAERIDAKRACQLALRFGERVSGLAVDWKGHTPLDIGEAEIEQVARLMLVEMAYRAALGWPGQLLRMPPRRWPAQLAAMVRRHRGVGVAVPAPHGEAGLGSALAYAVGAEGRSKIADAIRLTRWLRRG